MSTTFDWNQYRAVSPIADQKASPVQESKPAFDWNQYKAVDEPKSKPEEELPFQHENDFERESERSQSTITSRMLERILGFPGDVASLLPESFTSKTQLRHLPTSKKLREVSEEASLGYTSPKSEIEEKGGEFAADVASFVTGKPGASMLGTLGRSIGVPLAGLLAKEGLGKIGASSKTQEYGKLATMLTFDLWGLGRGIGQGGALKFGYKSLDQAKKHIPQGALADVRGLETSLNRLESELTKGITGPHTSESVRIINEMRGHIKNGMMEADKFPRLREDINKIIENAQGFQIGGPSKKIRQASVRNINQVKDAVIKAGTRWGKEQAPDFLKAWTEGNEALSVAHRSKAWANMIEKNTKIKNPRLRTLLGIHTYHHPVSALAMQSAKKGIELGTRFPVSMMYKIANSKVLRNLYAGVLKEAIKGNGQKIAILSKRLEEKLEEDQNSNGSHPNS